MSTASVPSAGSRRRDDLVVRARAVPRAVWVMAVLWGVIVRLLMAPWTAHGDANDSISMLLTQAHLNAATLFTVTVTLAPLVSVLWPGWGLLFGVLGLLPLHLYSSWALQLSAYLTLLGVAACGSWPRGTNALPALLALLVPAALCFSDGRITMVLAGNEVSAAPWTGSEPLVAFLMYVAVAVFAMLMHWALTSTQGDAELRAARRQLAAQQVEVRNEAFAVDERARLARDLHDIVAHRISLVAVRAETAPFIHPGMDVETRRILSDIADDARSALDEMREVLGVLHRSSEAGTRSPQPNASGIPGLLEDARSAGMEVMCIGALPALPDALGSIAYRVVQEALTNARRHGSGQVSIELSRTDQEAVIRVTNPCDGPLDVPGRGLTGMRERLSLVDGSLRTEVCEGVFMLTATLPLAAS